MKGTFMNRLPGLLLTVAFLVTEGLFLALLASTKLVPGKFLLIGGGIMLVLTVLLSMLMWDWRKKSLWATGAILVLIVVLLLGLASFYIYRTVTMLNTITNTTVGVSDVGIYVRADDPAQALEDARDYRFGILEIQDRENTDKVVALLEETYGGEIAVIPCDGIAKLVEELLLGENVDAIILNTSYFDLMREMEGMENISTGLRLLHLCQVETVVELPTEPPTEPPTDVPTEAPTQAQDTLPVFCVYLSGNDEYGSISAKGRSDVNILAVVNPNTRQVLLASTPRDYYIELPFYGGVMDKLTHAGIYGLETSYYALENLYDVDIDYYFRVNFSGFQDIIDALDGITVFSDYEFTSIDGYYFNYGENELDGLHALHFARERKSFPDGDNQRGKNQMKVIEAVIDKAISPTLLTRFNSIMESLEGSFMTDMPYDLMAQIVRDQLENGGAWNVVSESVSGYGEYRDCYSLPFEASVMIPYDDDVERVAELIDKVIAGEILPKSAS